MSDFLIESKNTETLPVVNPSSKLTTVSMKSDVSFTVLTKVFDELCGLKILGINLIKKINLPVLRISNRVWKIEAENGLFIYVCIFNQIIFMAYSEREFEAIYNLKPVATSNTNKTEIADVCAFLKWQVDLKEYHEFD